MALTRRTSRSRSKFAEERICRRGKQNRCHLGLQFAKRITTGRANQFKTRAQSENYKIIAILIDGVFSYAASNQDLQQRLYCKHSKP
jgi:hypothetical protein